ncbi:undecaprenyldiphospho-muramoylpentapeptide beta-N- acetylglucosaminyltransferase [Moraxella macacae 0408225]|uniref:UDP-N-acetylglucosamine--N-acetylmuramyl-(pentapeptide) pyrophosphoryl-undecaprenol N-acetylglucosamine transferase n=1 Tax=Moraxella macacae 0408225 TaxID=1230338 RepID=L2FA65_9GAMM|nr:undecaprenyldiphospho-muramoylpentapeptide beta-N-acetylglucosaminyltransferase [Moraxella macacae]ELA09636.1 undecaprenyldiphospho-muramoylpentapeptide beta-N- acetylglucosaminyltransferase [Moraxella macacae 0408225]
MTSNTLQKQPTILMMAAGTGGHVFPAIAVAHELQKQGAVVHWLGTLKGMENDLLANTDFIYHAIDMQGLRGNGIRRLLQAPNALLKATLACVKIIKSNQIDMVVGFGGYVTAPGGLGAKICQKPLVIHEQNAIAGMSNHYLAKIAKTVMQAFANTFTDLNPQKIITVGNPVRKAIINLPTPNQRINPMDTSPLKLLIVGGSLGSQALNNNIAPTLKQLESLGKPWQVRHQCGKNNFDATKAVYDKADLQTTDYEILPFITDMAQAYAWADVIVCRAGALTVSEVASVGLTAIFIPLPSAVDDHQTANAKSLSEQNAGFLLPQSSLDADSLSAILASLDRTKILQISNKARQFGNPQSTEQCAKIILDNLN